MQISCLKPIPHLKSTFPNNNYSKQVFYQKLSKSKVEVFDYFTNKIVKINYNLDSSLQVFMKPTGPYDQL